MRIKILGRTWKLRFVSNLGKDKWGDMDPKGPNKQIRIATNLPSKKEGETLIHESTHAAFDFLDESYVRNFAKDLMDILWKCGWRKMK